MAKFCSNCGAKLSEGADVCLKCGKIINTENITSDDLSTRSKLAAGLLGIFLGAWGIHNFYLGYTSKAVSQIIVTIITCGIGSLWGFIEGILILAGSIDTDSEGKKLRD